MFMAFTNTYEFFPYSLLRGDKTIMPSTGLLFHSFTWFFPAFYSAAAAVMLEEKYARPKGSLSLSFPPGSREKCQHSVSMCLIIYSKQQICVYLWTNVSPERHFKNRFMLAMVILLIQNFSLCPLLLFWSPENVYGMELYRDFMLLGVNVNAKGFLISNSWKMFSFDGRISK
jgi:hypothetical protein